MVVLNAFKLYLNTFDMLHHATLRSVPGESVVDLPGLTRTLLERQKKDLQLLHILWRFSSHQSVWRAQKRVRGRPEKQTQVVSLDLAARRAVSPEHKPRRPLWRHPDRD